MPTKGTLVATPRTVDRTTMADLVGVAGAVGSWSRFSTSPAAAPTPAPRPQWPGAEFLPYRCAWCTSAGAGSLSAPPREHHRQRLRLEAVGPDHLLPLPFARALVARAIRSSG